jgi:hypothetical protein
MKKIVFAFVITIFTFLNVNAQKIEVKKSFGENSYYQNGEKLTMNQLKEVLKNNTETLVLIKSAKSNYTWSSVLGVSGGALIGIPIGTVIGGGDPKWEVAGLGAVLILVAIPLLNNYNKKSKAAVDLYNAGLPAVSASFQPRFNLNFKGTSFGITMNF